MKPSRFRPVFAACSLALLPLAVSSLGAAEPATTTSMPASETLPVVGPSPAWKLTDLTGKEIGRDALLGKVVVVDFWATWCPPCVHEIPGYVELQKKYADKGLVIVGISLDRNVNAVKPFALKKAINYPLAMGSSEIADVFGGVEAIPTTFLIDREGNIRHKKTGSMEAEDYEKLLAPLL